MPFLKILPIFLSSLSILLIIYFQISFELQQQFVLILTFLFILLGNRYTTKNDSKFNLISKKLSNFILIFLTCCLVQLTVVFTGGFFSPLLILFHIFGLFTGFFLSFWTSLSFLFLSVALLIAQIFLTPAINAKFMEDPAYVILFIVSFIIIIPVIQYVSKSYNLKSSLLDKLNSYLTYTQNKDRLILEGLNDMVFILNLDFKIISFNKAVNNEILLGEAELLNKPFFETISLKDSSGLNASPDSFTLPQIIDGKQSRTFENFTFISPSRSQSFKVTIQIRPVLDSSDSVKEIIIVISHAFLGSQFKHQDLKDSLTKTQLLNFEFTKKLRRLGYGGLLSDYLLIYKIQSDIRIAQDLEDHLIEANITPKDIIPVLENTLTQKEELARSLGVIINFLRPAVASTPAPVPLDPEWFKIMFSRLLDLALFLKTSPGRPILVHINPEQNSLNIAISFEAPTSVIDNKDLILDRYSEKLSPGTKMLLSSRLEGFIAQNIASQLNIKLSTEADIHTNTLMFKISLPQNPPAPAGKPLTLNP